MIASRSEEDLRFVLEATEGLGVDDAIAIALERGTNAVLRLRVEPAPRVGALGRLGRERFPFPRLQFLANARWGLGVRLGSGPIAHLAHLLAPGDGAQETGSIRKAADVEQFGKGLPEIRKRGSRAEIDTGTDARTGGDHRYVLA